MPSHITYFGIVLILGTSLVVLWGVFWAKTRSVLAARVLCLCLVLTVITILDGALAHYSEGAFERVIASDWRYRIYVKGWLQSKELQERVFRHQKTDTSVGPYTAGFRCKMLESDFIVGPNGFRRHNRRPIDMASRIVMCLGGSTTFGMTVEPSDKPYPDVLEDVLTETRPSLADVRVINAGVPGAHVGYCLDMLTEWNSEASRVIVFCEAINWLDASIRGRVTARNSYLASVGDSLWTRLRAIWNVDRYAGRAYDIRLRKFVAAVEALPAQLVLMTFAMPYTSQADRGTLRYYDVMQNGQSSAYAAARLVEVHNEILRNISREKNIPCVDLARELTGQEHLFIDTCHFTQEGRQRVARLCAPAIARLLDKDAPPPTGVVDDFDPEKTDRNSVESVAQTQ